MSDPLKTVVERYLFNLRLVCDNLDEEDIGRLGALVLETPRCFVAGVGRTGDIVHTFATRLSHLGRASYAVFGAGSPSLGKDDLLMVASGSGATPTMIAAAQEARKREARVAVITSNALSPLARGADLRVVLPPMLPPATPDQDLLQPIQIVFQQSLLLVLDALGESLAARLSPADGEAARS